MFVSNSGIKKKCKFNHFSNQLHKWDNQWKTIASYAKMWLFIVKRMD